MASPPPASPRPLSPLQLSPSVVLHQPTFIAEDGGASRSSDDEGPRLIILATWAFAQDNHIAKYVNNYQELFPNASVLVIKCFLRHFFWLPAAREELVPAASAIRSILGTDEDNSSNINRPSSKPSLILHVFSNSGLNTAYNVNDVYSETYPEDRDDNGSKQLPPHATIYDSSPGRFSYWSVASAVLYGIPPSSWFQRLAVMPFAHFLSASLWVWVHVLGNQDWVSFWARAANEPALVLETCRSYAYSTADPLVEWHAVESHAEAARARGFAVLHLSNFGKSAHVSHSRADPGRYWKIIRETWEGGVAKL